MNKNWNDRADKDLFFTILSVKNIGVISGAEWTTIGNHMRSLGYGFTNEGCRQHFQGLRRAQHKTEPNGSMQDLRRSDPTQNPITRRPGPGRGRPRKQPPSLIDGSTQEVGARKPLPNAAAAATSTEIAIPVDDSDTLDLVQDDSGLEEQPSKRQRLDEDDQQQQQQQDDDDSDAAVLSLAAATEALPPPEDHYGASDYYGEA
ncbi:hypothetical protein F5Y04DRAFT_148645 [Hypomontagnella monticulosa]|nr:hypothetical protein F5Y04DRAFT_148645 [Hypomontagnella monticulosa]